MCMCVYIYIIYIYIFFFYKGNFCVVLSCITHSAEATITWGGPCGEELRPPANNQPHGNEASWK